MSWGEKPIFAHQFQRPSYDFKERGSGPKFKKTFFEIMVDPKVPPSEPIFWSGFETRDLSAPAWRPRPFPAKNIIFVQKASKS